MNVHMPRVLERHSPAVRQAGGSSFYLAMRILPREQRIAMFEVYSFCRAVDDIADCHASHEWRLRRLAEWRRDIDAIFRGRGRAEFAGMARVIDHFSLRKADFDAVIDGMEMDAAQDTRAPDAAWLDLYCDRVACAVGRLSVRIFGMSEKDGMPLAHHLGRALQLTNILRDLDEDAGNGRLYLPRQALRHAGIDETDPMAAVCHPAIAKACDAISALATEHFAAAGEIMHHCPRRVVVAPKIMQVAYRQLLDDLIARGWSSPRTRIRVNKLHIFLIAMRHAFV